MPEDLLRKLEMEVDLSTWRDLRAHAARDKLFIVTPKLTLVQVGMALAGDDAVAVQNWIEAGLLVRPSRAQMDVWEGQLDQTFRCLIVSPFVLAQLASTGLDLN